MKNRLVLFLLVLLLFTSCSNSESENVSKIIRPVKTKVVQKRNVYEKIFSGITDANDNSKLAFKVGGQIFDFPVSSGEYIRKGNSSLLEIQVIYSCSIQPIKLLMKRQKPK